MHKGNIVVTPDEPLARVQRVMTEANIGQIPVVAPETREIVGIITRTDLLKQAAPARSGAASSGRVQIGAERAAMMERLAAALPPATMALLRRVASEAHQQGHEPYLVGGIVRDLLLGAPIRDLDIVIQGNAIPVARRLARALGGRVVAHDRFGTTKWILREPGAPLRDPLLEAEGLPGHIDLITSRTEFYERPTALPQVEHASIKQDLHRRDFTINTLALALDPEHEGQLLDFYGGMEDLERGRIRVLHNLSFVEDPTRILRAIRFEQRFGFRLEARTEELLLASLDLLEAVSPDRLRHELFLIMEEGAPERTLQRLGELGILRRLMPEVHWDASDAGRLQRLRAAGYREPAHFLTALIWNPEAGQGRIDRISERLGLSKEWRERLHTLYEVRARRDELVSPELPPSGLYALLHERDRLALELLAVMSEDEALRGALRLYLDDLSQRLLEVTGDLLRQKGLPPGPAYRGILDAIRAAMLDGRAPDRQSQLALLEEELARRG
jgi:tRNA nucleotidyltransferase (CCA-adding enzyme)